MAYKGQPWNSLRIRIDEVSECGLGASRRRCGLSALEARSLLPSSINSCRVRWLDGMSVDAVPADPVAQALGQVRRNLFDVGASQRDVLAGTHLAVGKRPYLAVRRDEHGPVQIGLGAVIDQELGESFSFGSQHRQRRIELQHGVSLNRVNGRMGQARV